MKDEIGESARNALGEEGAQELAAQMKDFIAGISIDLTREGMTISGRCKDGFEVIGGMVQLKIMHGGVAYQITLKARPL